jgi:coenzyme F420-0:L-glutamate ligase / coenzyme F420-1:gamma-L-glutamate ligase
MGRISIIPVKNIPLIQEGDDLIVLLLRAIEASQESLKDKDIVVFSHKIISKAEGRTVDLNSVKPSEWALALGNEVGKDPRVVHLILEESTCIVRKAYERLIVKHKGGWICANAGIDYSNVPGDYVALLPRDPDGTAESLRNRIRHELGVEVAVMIIDSQGRPFRKGVVSVALGYSGMQGLINRVGDEDLYGYVLRSTEVALADQVASAASMAMGEGNEGLPVVIVRGIHTIGKGGSAKDLLRDEHEDLFL